MTNKFLKLEQTIEQDIEDGINLIEFIKIVFDRVSYSGQKNILAENVSKIYNKVINHPKYNEYKIYDSPNSSKNDLAQFYTAVFIFQDKVQEALSPEDIVVESRVEVVDIAKELDKVQESLAPENKFDDSRVEAFNIGKLFGKVRQNLWCTIL